MNAFSRSWDLTKTTLSVIKQDKELFAFPILATITMIVFFLIFGITFFIMGIVSFVGGFSMGVLGWIFLIIMYLFLSLISTFFSVCIVYTAGVRFSGKDATLGQSIAFAFKRFDKIFLWSIISATVGVILKTIENMAENAKGAGKIIFGIIRWVLGAAWTISTIFVIQGIAYKNLGPFAAIKDSVLTLKKAWGESLIKYIGFGVVQSILSSIGILIFLGLLALHFVTGQIWLLIVSVFLIVIYLSVVSIFFNLADEVFDTALYVYANTGNIVDGFSSEQMKEALKSESPQLRI